MASPSVQPLECSESSVVPPARLTPPERHQECRPTALPAAADHPSGARQCPRPGIITHCLVWMIVYGCAQAGSLSRFLRSRWTLGGLLSLVFIWIVSALFCDSSEPYSYDAATKSWVIAPGSRILWRSEGRGTSYFGKFGIGCVPDVSRETRGLILLWGDSDVEAFQVDDQQKVAQQLTRLLQQRGHDLVCVSRAMGGDNLADHILNIPEYEKQLPSLTRHVIVINGPDDILPDQANDTRGVFRTSHGYELLRSPAHYHSSYVKSLIDDLRLYFTMPLLRSLTRDLSLRFSLGPARGAPDSRSARAPQPSDLREAWNFLARSIREATHKDVTILYVPHVPAIGENQVLCDDPDWPLVREFGASCRAAGIDFIDMREIFLRYYETTGRFPRGFPNSRPGDGHLNAAGQRLIAQALLEYLEKVGL